ncbi:uncharacterized protein LOC110975011 isoform X2 [Acanthaster planci]|uniref:Uncharacterized protein LOC110975011 isoform X2 n=1 Tax=Acanthaster planci TaxID=133434 RepID=A0A8B7XRY0_ACAPL|nr:uncharacterized protein LOC110975011 isoform X2 [Acanthaster planci]XP_022082755.1 uncharacterized protein LOC110975011 isoform X2 [Acanthaster planci]
MCRGQSFCHVLSRASLLLLISLSVWLIGGSTQKHQTLAYAVDAAGRSLVSIEVAKDVSCLFPELEKECAVKLKIKRSGSRGRNRKERVDEGGTKERVEVNRQDEAKRDEKANLSKKLRRHLRRDPELYEILINNTYGVNSTGESISEPHCALHLQYVVVVRDIVSLDSSQRSELKFYVNKRDELRFYSCYPCRVCPPGIPLLLPCHGRSNTLCDDFGVKRENSDEVVDADNLDCVPLVSTDPGKTTASQPLPTTRVTSTRTGFHFHIPKLGNRDDLPAVNREVDLPSSSPHHKPTGTRITIITAGVVFLNVLFLFMLIITAVRCHKGLKYRIKYTKTHHCYGSINNESSAHQLGLTPSSRHQATSPLPSISNQVHVNKRQIIAGVDRNTRQVV